MSKHRFAKVAVAAAVVLMAASVAVVRPTDALAWTGTLTGTPVCNTTTGNYDVTWNFDNSTNAQPFTVTSSNRAAIAVGDSVPANGNRDFTESLPGTTAGTTTLNIAGGWPSDLGPHPFTAHVTTSGTCAPSGPPPCTSNCTPPPPPPPPAPADLGIVKTADKTVYNIGDTVTYTLVVTNHGPGNALDVGVDDPGHAAQTGNPNLPVTLPTNLDSYAVTTTQGMCQLAAQTIRCTLGEIDNGGVVTITVTAHAVSAGTAVNSACVGTDKTADQNVAANNCSTTTITVNGPPVAVVPPVATPPTKAKPPVKAHKPPIKKHHKAKKPPVKHHKVHHKTPVAPKQPKYTP